MNPISKLLALGKRAYGTQGTQGTQAAEHIERALSAAGLDQTGSGRGIRETIDRALSAAGLRPADGMSAPAPAAAGRPDSTAPMRAATVESVPARGQFLHATYGNAYSRRDYRLYLPVGYDPDGAPRPLILMLHGCTQSAEDFAAGTRMNALADREGFLVAYPQQIGKANHARCWNWFRPEDQRGDAGEPSILAGIASQIAQGHRVDTRRIFVAGLSAGAAMAVILGHTRPDLVRAIGVHSGLPYASAHDVASAFTAMQGRADTSASASASGASPVPMIVFHGDADRTVAPANADALAAGALRPGLRISVETGRAVGGQAYTRQVATDTAGIRAFERWTVHGAGHAWSGGDPTGSYTDPAGPDASTAMVAFFLQQA